MITIKKHSPIPKYQQIINCITYAIDHKLLRKGQPIPSINSLTKEHKLSQDTVLKAYNQLKARGIVSSKIGKGYYIASTKLNHQRKIFLLFDRLTSYKELLYESFLKTLGDSVAVEIFFHHFNKKVFHNLIEDAKGKYTSYVIMPISDKKSIALVDTLPKNSVFILDQGRSSIGKMYPSVCQNFHKDLYSGLAHGMKFLEKYERLILVAADNRKHLKEIIQSFKNFCLDHDFTGATINSMDSRKVAENEAYIVINDKDLVYLVKEIERANLILGKDCGIISYNDTELKEIIAGGITVISTDFEAMGRRMAELIINREKVHIHNPSKLIIRNSL